MFHRYSATIKSNLKWIKYTVYFVSLKKWVDQVQLKYKKKSFGKLLWYKKGGNVGNIFILLKNDHTTQ